MTRVQAGLVLLLVAVVLLGLMWWGWRGRLRRQSGVAQLPEPPVDVGDVLLGPIEATYVSSTTAGQWLDRVAARELGLPSAAQVTVTSRGISIVRQGATDVWIDAAALDGVRRQAGIAGKVVGGQGLVVLTWRLGSVSLDTGLRPRYSTDRDALAERAAELAGSAA